MKESMCHDSPRFYNFEVNCRNIPTRNGHVPREHSQHNGYGYQVPQTVDKSVNNKQGDHWRYRKYPHRNKVYARHVQGKSTYAPFVQGQNSLLIHAISILFKDSFNKYHPYRMHRIIHGYNLKFRKDRFWSIMFFTLHMTTYAFTQLSHVATITRSYQSLIISCCWILCWWILLISQYRKLLQVFLEPLLVSAQEKMHIEWRTAWLGHALHQGTQQGAIDTNNLSETTQSMRQSNMEHQ